LAQGASPHFADPLTKYANLLWPFAIDTNNQVSTTFHPTTMANNDWRDALVLCGIPQNRVGQFNAALGEDDLEEYMELPLVDHKGDFEMVAKNPAYAQVVSIHSIKKCIALRAWGEYMLLRNQQFETADFDQQTLDRFLQYVVWLNKIDKEMESYREATVTPTLKTSSDWLKFERQVDTQLQTYSSSVLKHSLRYVIQPNAGVTEEMLEADYPSLDADLYMTAALAGPQFQADNKHVTELLTAWLGLTDWWTFLCRFAPTKDGSAAWLALKAQMEGPAAVDARKKKAHLDLTTSYYKGKSKNYTWDDYIRVRQEAHLELGLLEAPVDDMRKVDLMFEGVKAEALGPVVLALKANGNYAEDFDAAQKQIKKAIVNMGIKACQAAAQRSISAVGTGPSGNNAGGGGGEQQEAERRGSGRPTGQQSAQPKFAAQDNPDVKIHAGFYPPKVYHSLSKKQQDAVEALRKEKKKNKKDGSSIGAVVVVKPPTATEPSDGVAADTKEGESPDESPEAGDPATAADGSGAPTDDEDSVIAVEDTKPAAISFGRAAYAKKPAPEQTQIVAAVAVEAKPVEGTAVKAILEPLGPRKGWNKFTKGGKFWHLCTQKEKNEAIFELADYAHWRDHEKDGEDGGAEGHYCRLEFGMVQSRFMDDSACPKFYPGVENTPKAVREFLTKQAYEALRAKGYPKHR
jgi:hypothetical protein